MDRQGRISLLVEHARNPRHEGALEGADVTMPGGGPECGGSVVVYLKGDGNGRIEDLRMAAAVLYVGGSLVLGLLAVVVGLRVTRRVVA